MAGRVPTSANERFAEKCAPPLADGCVLWTGGTTQNGYGLFHVGPGKRMMTAHRWALEQEIGSLPSDVDACHKCDVRLCVNAAHLFAGTRKENMQDAARKGRTSRAPRPSMQGEKHHKAVLDEESVIRIRTLHQQGVSQSALARESGISVNAIWAIVHRKTWIHVI